MSRLLCWLSQTSADVPDDNDWLSENERSILAGMRFAKRRQDWRLGRWTAKKAICAYRSCENLILSSLEIRAAEDGTPEAFLNGAPAMVCLSISHSNGIGFCALGPAEISIGCDLERIEAREGQFIEDYFTPEEIAICKSFGVEKDLATNLIWSAKESTLKAVRQGLRRDTRSVLIQPVSWSSKDSWNMWTGHCLESSRTFYGWWRFQKNYVYTLASDQRTASPEQLCL
jgi:4'-phosphopantetheinyl transferase